MAHSLFLLSGKFGSISSHTSTFIKRKIAKERRKNKNHATLLMFCLLNPQTNTLIEILQTHLTNKQQSSWIYLSAGTPLLVLSTLARIRYLITSNMLLHSQSAVLVLSTCLQNFYQCCLLRSNNLLDFNTGGLLYFCHQIILNF